MCSEALTMPEGGETTSEERLGPRESEATISYSRGNAFARFSGLDIL
jgi:hypothetical protein